MRAGRFSAVLGVIVVGIMMSGVISESARAHVPEVGGVVQQWSPDLRHLVVDDIRYPLAAGFQVVDENGRTLSAFQVKVGSRVRLIELDGGVHEIVLLPDGSGQ